MKKNLLMYSIIIDTAFCTVKSCLPCIFIIKKQRNFCLTFGTRCFKNDQHAGIVSFNSKLSNFN